MPDFPAERERMVQEQIAARGIRDPRLLEAMRTVPREAFLAEKLHEFAYHDSPLPIESGQTISQPYIVALMIDAARPASGDTVLEIGAGSGYAAAILSRMAREVFTVERDGVLAELAHRRLHGLGYTNVHVGQGDGSLGWPEHGPYDAILVAAGGPRVPESLCEQLADGGRLVIPIGSEGYQRLIRLTRRGDRFEKHDLGDVRFVPLVGEEAWDGPSNPASPRPEATYPFGV